MKKVTLALLILTAVACKKETPPEAIAPTPAPTIPGASSKFLGVWKAANFGGAAHEVLIEKVDNNTIKIYGVYTATVSGNEFTSGTINTVYLTGELTDGVLYYCQKTGLNSVCADFNK